MFNKTFIAPILSVFSATNYIYVWNGSQPPRPMAGFAPQNVFASITEPSAGNVSAGVHKIAVSFITDTGFTTRPGPEIAGSFVSGSINSSGGKNIHLTGIPTGPTGIVARQLFVTKSGLLNYFYAPNGLINDNTTTVWDLNFFDTDLAVSADQLFNLLEFVISYAGVFGGMGLQKYHGSLFVIGAEKNLVRVSNSGDAESFSNVTGFIQLPDEGDGNDARAAVSLFDVLYFFKSVGIFSTQDNFSGNPSSWPVIQIDGGAGAFNPAISTITASQVALSSASYIVFGNREGLFAFNGNVIRPQLSWKIQDIWDQISHGFESQMSIVQDNFNDLLYIVMPIQGSPLPSLFLVADYSSGLDANSIKWSIYFFPWTVRSIEMAQFNDGFDNDYYLRLGLSSSAGLFKLTKNQGLDPGNVTVDSYYQSTALTIDPGAMNIFRFLRARVTKSVGNLKVTLKSSDGVTFQTPPSIPITTIPNAEVSRQINFTSEKMVVRLETNSSTDSFTLQRLDIHGKVKWQSRPNA
jgi:hypothetical protein